jgi:hypothetical protein
MYPECPNCGAEMQAGDSGEPECISGWWCDQCEEFWADGDLLLEYDDDDLED